MRNGQKFLVCFIKKKPYVSILRLTNERSGAQMDSCAGRDGACYNSRLRQKDFKFHVNLGYRVRPASKRRYMLQNSLFDFCLDFKVKIR